MLSGFSLILVLGVFTAPTALAKGAFAFSQDPITGNWVIASAFNESSQTAANEAAIRTCRSKGGLSCRVIREVHNGCHSIAITNEGVYAIASGNSQRQAQDRSLTACLASEPFGSCVIRRSFCDNTDGFRPADASPTPLQPGPDQFFCRSANDYRACIRQRQPAYGIPQDRENYCRMAFC